MFWKWGDAWVHEIFGFLLVVKLDSEFFAEFIFVFAFRQVQHVHFLQQFGRGCPKCISTGGHRRVLEYSHSISFHLMSFQNIDVKIHPPPKKKVTKNLLSSLLNQGDHPLLYKSTQLKHLFFRFWIHQSTCHLPRTNSPCWSWELRFSSTPLIQPWKRSPKGWALKVEKFREVLLTDSSR